MTKDNTTTTHVLRIDSTEVGIHFERHNGNDEIVVE